MSRLMAEHGSGRRNPLCGTDWGRLLNDEFAAEYWEKLTACVEEERSSFPDRVYPPANEVFRALELTWCEETKVVIVGQDPYHGFGQAHGLCFSVPCGIPPPPSLKNIHKELNADLGLPIPDHGSLVPWAHRGVLLLNTTLTVGETARSHQGRGWETFTDAVIQVVCQESDPVFLLWGEKAQAKEELVTRTRGSPGKIIKSSHPSPPAAYRPCCGSPPFIGSKPFRKVNDLLAGLGRGEIDWNLAP